MTKITARIEKVVGFSDLFEVEIRERGKIKTYYYVESDWLEPLKDAIDSYLKQKEA